jgi:protein TonB
MKLSIQKSFVVLLVLLTSRTASGQAIFEINLHLYKPLAESRVVFEDSILTFYAPYKAGKETHFPIVYFHRQDYSNDKILIPFRVATDAASVEMNKEFIKKQKNETKVLVALISDKKNRQIIEAKPELHAKKGLRMYDCNFEDNPSRKTFHLFLGSKSDSKTNHFANIKAIKKKISSILIDNPEAIINIHFSDRNKLCNGDDTYVNHSIKYLTYNGDRMGSSLKEKEALKITKQNKDAIINKLQVNTEQVIFVHEDITGYSTGIDSQNRIYFEANFATKHKHPTTKKYLDERGFSYLGSYLLRIELDRKGDYLSVQLKKEILPDFSNRYYENYGDVDADAFESISAPVEPAPYPPTTDPNENEIVGYVQSEPEYPGGIGKLYEDIYHNFTYPELERQNKIQGTVFISFVVEKAGNITDIRIDRGVNGGPNLSKEAIKSVKKLKPFTPAKMNGKPVRYRYRLPIKFILRD